MNTPRSSHGHRLGLWVAWVLPLLAGSALAASPTAPSPVAPSAGPISREVRAVLGPQLQLLRPLAEGFPSMFALGPEFAVLWQFEQIQLRLQARLSVAGGQSSTTGASDASFKAWGLSGDVGARVALGGFAEGSAGYVFAYPAFFSRHVWTEGAEGERQAHLNELALQLGVGHIFHPAHAPKVDVSAMLFHLHVNPEVLRTQLAFTPGLSIVFAL